MSLIRQRLGSARLRNFGTEVFWSLSSRVAASLLQVVVITLLARGLPPGRFALVSTANVILMAVPAINGFGLNRQIQYRRSRMPDDPQLPALFARRLRYSYASATAWSLGSFILWTVTRESIFLAMVPAGLWLLAEQTTQVWNGLSLVDKRAKNLMSSYLWRRAPVVVTLLVAPLIGLDIIWAWTIGLAVGASLAWLTARRHQEPWAQVAWPRRPTASVRTDLDFGYWWSQLGEQVRDLDVPALAAVDPVDAGIYALPARLIRPMNLITVAMGSVAFPILIRRRHVRSRELVVGVALASTPTVIIAATLAVLAPFVPDLVGEAYAASVVPMQVMCLTAVAVSPTYLVTVYLQSRGAGATRLSGSVVFSTNVFQVGAAVAGALLAGATGAAVFSLGAQVLSLILIISATVWWSKSVPARESAARHDEAGTA